MQSAEPPSFSSEEVRQIQQTLRILQDSKAFRAAHRASQFLSYIIEKTLAGQTADLKERTIGIEVFGRKQDYATGEDPIVRVQAGDVRRRLDRFYAEAVADVPVKVSLPLGTYCPRIEFHSFGNRLAALQTNDKTPAANGPDEKGPAVLRTVLDSQAATSIPISDQSRPHTAWRTALFIALLCCLGLAILLWVVGRRTPLHASSAANAFWAPIAETNQPVLIYAAKAVSYRPDAATFERYAAQHPGTFTSEWQRMSIPLPPQALQGHSMVPMEQFGVASGDVYASALLTTMLTGRDKASQLRIGPDLSFEDLRKSPAVLIGAFNNRWTMLLDQGQPLYFDEKPDRLSIAERDGAHRSWSVEPGARNPNVDYAMVLRLLNGPTGQFDVIVAGIGTHGTLAAAEFVTNPERLNSALATLNGSWQRRNLAFVLETTVTDDVSGPPKLLTSRVW